jgi:hypothetical protein
MALSMKLMRTILLLLLCTLSLVERSHAQVKPENRYPFQSYCEDSAHVFWTWYPNPFSPPTINDTSKGMICGGLTFYCDLSDTVTIALLNTNDSVVYEAPVRLSSPPHFSLCYWLAGPKVDIQGLPSHYFRSDSQQKYRLLLVVHGRRKCVTEYGIFLPANWYCWIDDFTQRTQ